MNEVTTATPTVDPRVSERSEVATVTAAPPPAITEGPGALLSAIVQMARDRSIDRDMLAFLMDRQERMEDRQAEQEFNEALSKAQSEIEPVVRDADNDQTRSKYATLLAVNRVIRPIYTAHGFSLAFATESLEGPNVRIVCDVSRGRHTRRYQMDAPPDTLGPKGAPVKTALHGLGSTFTYLRNKLTCGIFNVVLRNEDDDGVRGGMKFIAPEEAEEIEELITRTHTDRPRFLQYFQIADVFNLPADAFTKARNMLLAKLPKPKPGAAP